jgi:hypothetical protein
MAAPSTEGPAIAAASANPTVAMKTVEVNTKITVLSHGIGRPGAFDRLFTLNFVYPIIEV